MKTRRFALLAFLWNFMIWLWSILITGMIINILATGLFNFSSTDANYIADLRKLLLVNLFHTYPLLTSVMFATVIILTFSICLAVLLERRTNQENQRDQRIFVKYREQLANALSLELAKDWQINPSKHSILPLRLSYYDETRSMQQEFAEVSIEFALKEKRLFLLLGAPGTGKTTFLTYLALHSSQGFFQDVSNLPVLIKLYQTRSESVFDLENAIQKTIASYAGKQPKNEEILKFLRHGRLLLLFDGLDETRDSAKTIESVLQFSMRYNQCQMVVTGRGITDHQFIRFQAIGFKNLSIQPTSDSELRYLVNHWSTDYKVNPEMFWNTLQENPALLSVARNPLTLRLMLRQYQEQNKFLGQVSPLTDVSLKALLPRSYQQLTSIMHWLAGQLAFYMSIHERKYINFSEISSQAMLVNSQYHDLTKVEEDLQFLQNEHIMIKVDQTNYGFTHLLIQEYFSAQLLKNIETKQLLDLCYEYAGNKKWESILILIARERSDIVEIVSDLLLSNSPTQWLLAAKCLRESTQANTNLELKAVQKLCSFLNEEYSEQALRISNILAQFQSRETNDFCFKLFSGKGNDPLTIASLAFVLAEQGTSEELVCDALLRTIQDEDATVRYQTCRALGAFGKKSSLEILIKRFKVEADNKVLLQIISELERIEGLSRRISQSTLAVLLAELRRRTFFSEDKGVQTQIEHLFRKITIDISSSEER